MPVQLAVENIEELIFPLVIFKNDQRSFECLGTGFFINQEGWFLTAKHVLAKNIGLESIKVMGIQSTNNNERHFRFVTHFFDHSFADITIGKLGESHDAHTNRIETIRPLIAKIDLAINPVGEKLVSYGYPQTTSSVEGTKTTFNFKSGKYNGNIVEWVEKSPRLNYPCYQTNLNFQNGASGGPVFNESGVIGIHSTNFNFQEDGEIVSYVTPINLVLQLPIMNSEGRTISCLEAMKPIPPDLSRKQDKLFYIP